MRKAPARGRPNIWVTAVLIESNEMPGCRNHQAYKGRELSSFLESKTRCSTNCISQADSMFTRFIDAVPVSYFRSEFMAEYCHRPFPTGPTPG